MYSKEKNPANITSIQLDILEHELSFNAFRGSKLLSGDHTLETATSSG